MALAHMTLKASSKNASAKCSYISATNKYEHKSDSLIVIDYNMPDCSSAEFWKACDKNERKNANLFKEFEVALPRELTEEQSAHLVDDFVNEFIPNQPATVAFHKGKNGDNPHFHAMFSMRENDNVERDDLGTFFRRANKKNPHMGGAPKLDKWKGGEFMLDARKRWQTLCNQHLEMSGSDARIDMRTLKAQGIDRKPQPKIGPIAQAIENRKKGSSTRVQRFEEIEAWNRGEFDVEIEVDAFEQALIDSPSKQDMEKIEMAKMQVIRDNRPSIDNQLKRLEFLRNRHVELSKTKVVKPTLVTHAELVAKSAEMAELKRIEFDADVDAKMGQGPISRLANWMTVRSAKKKVATLDLTSKLEVENRAAIAAHKDMKASIQSQKVELSEEYSDIENDMKNDYGMNVKETIEAVQKFDVAMAELERSLREQDIEMSQQDMENGVIAEENYDMDMN